MPQCIHCMILDKVEKSYLAKGISIATPIMEVTTALAQLVASNPDRAEQLAATLQICKHFDEILAQEVAQRREDDPAYRQINDNKPLAH